MYVVGYAIHTSIYVSVGSFVKSIGIYFSESLSLRSVLSHLLIFLWFQHKCAILHHLLRIHSWIDILSLHFHSCSSKKMINEGVNRLTNATSMAKSDWQLCQRDQRAYHVHPRHDSGRTARIFLLNAWWKRSHRMGVLNPRPLGWKQSALLTELIRFHHHNTISTIIYHYTLTKLHPYSLPNNHT